MEKMLKIWFTLLSMALLSARALYMDDVEKYTKKFFELSEFGKDPAEAIQILTENLEELFELGKPIGALLASVNPDKEQKAALLKLNETMHGKLRELGYSKEKYGDYARDSVQYMNIELELVSLSDYYYDAAAKFNSWREIHGQDFEKECWKDVPAILQHMKQYYLPPACSLPSKEDVLVHASILHAFNELQPYFYTQKDTFFKTIPERQRFIFSLDKSNETFARMKQLILTIVNVTKKAEVDHLFHVLEASKTKPNELLDYMTDRVSPMRWSAENEKCQWDYVVKTSSYARSELNARLNQLRFDMALLAGISSACANLTSKGNPEEEDKFLKYVRGTIKAIVEYVVLWPKAASEISWPEIDKEMVKTSLIEQVSISSEVLEKNANILQNLLNKRAPPGYYHQVLMAENTKFDVLTHKPANYWNLKYGKYMIHVFRLKLHNGNEKSGLSQWFQENYDTMQKHITDSFSQNLSADALLKNMNNTFNLIEENRWTAALLVKNEAIFCSWAELTGALGATNGTGYSDVSEIRLQHNVWYRCTNSRIFLFV